MPDDPNGTHRVVHKRHLIAQGAELPLVYEVGDRITPTEGMLRSHPDRFEPVEDEESDDSDEVEEDSDGDEQSDPGEYDPENMSVPDVRAWADNVDDPDVVLDAVDSEYLHDGRVTAIDALESRLVELEPEPDEVDE